MNHGHYVTYNKGCRCRPCTDAKTAYNRQRREILATEQSVEERREKLRAARKKRREGPIPGHVHGTWNGYTNYGCKCSRCLEACRARYPQSKKWRDANREHLNAYQKQYRETVLKPREQEKEELAKTKRLAK